MMNNKFCEKCGASLADDAKFCEECGAQISTPSQPMDQTIADYSQPQPSPQIQYPTQNQSVPQNKYSKMGGWLLVFVIANIIGMLSSLGTIGKEIQDTITAISYYSTYIYTGATALYINILAQIVALAATTFSVLFLIQIFQRKPLFLRFVQIGSILAFVSTIITLFVCIQIGWGNYDSSFIGNIIGSVIGNIAGFFLMTLYYCKSIRVRTYMHNDEYMEKAIFLYKQPPLI